MEETADLTDASADERGTDEPREQMGKSGGRDAELAFEQSEDQPATGEPAEEVGAVSIQGLQQELGAVRAQADEFLDGWQRARAEFANYKKRTAREQEEARERIAGETISMFLGIADDLERALRDRPQQGEATSWAEGIELIHRKLMTLLESQGVEVIPAEGEEFDPSLHEALSHEESDGHSEGQVIEVIQPGYRMGERVLRPALVRVAK